MQIERIDHVVLTVEDIERTCDFYHDVLGFEVREFSGGRTAMHFGPQKINLHQKEQKIEPRASVPTLGSADLCFVTSTPIKVVVHELAEKKIDIVTGPTGRTGALGDMLSVYLRDPDGNLIEISNYTPE
jgi:catechol 2,3-dioxygenase-like lactoylglutathione lyase family enzyme